MEQLDKVLAKIKPTEDQKIEIIKKVMNYKIPTKPDGVQTDGVVTWTSGDHIVKLQHDRPVIENSTFKVTVKNAADQLQYEVLFYTSAATEISMFYHQGVDIICAKYIFTSKGEFLYARYIDYVSQLSMQTTNYIRVEKNGDMDTNGKVNPYSFLYKKYEELRSALHPTSLAEVASPEIISQVNAWVSYLMV
jgi:hypothetical protein